MTENDKELLKKADALNCIEWAEADLYMDLADSLEVKEKLRKIASRLYREEEASIGLL